MEKYKSYLRIGTILCFLSVIACFVFAFEGYKFANIYQKDVDKNDTFSVTGEGQAVGVPDVAEFTFSVITQGGTNIAQTQQTNTNAVNGAIAFVKSEGVDPKDITTENYNIDPQYQNNCKGSSVCPAVIVGYNITQDVSVKIRDFSKIGDILSGVVTKGANSVSELSFTIDNLDTIKEQARTQAIANAITQAKSLASSANIKLGPIVSITDESQPIVGSVVEKYAASAFNGGAAPAAPVVEAGSQTVTENIALTYQIQ